MAGTIVKTIPAADRTGPGEHCTTMSGEVYIISQNQTGIQPKFTLWHQVPGGYVKIATNIGSPVPLQEKIPWYDKEARHE